MKRKISKWLSITIPLILGVFLVVYSYNKFTKSEILEIKSHFINANYNYIYIAVFVAILGSASRAYRWKYVLDQMGYKTTFVNNFMAVSIGYLINLTIPRSGEISRALVLKKYNDIPFDKGFGTIIAERIIDMIFLAAFIIIAFFVQFDIVKTFILDKLPIQKIIILLFFGFIIFICCILFYRYSKAKFLIQFKIKISGLKEGLLSTLHMKRKWSYFGHTIFIWVSYVFTFYIGIFIIPETNTLSFEAVLTSFVVGSIAIAFTNSGFGSYPFLIAKILLFYNIPETAGNAFGWIIWTSQMLILLFLGSLSLLLLPILNRSK